MRRFKYPLFTLIGLLLMAASIKAQTPIAQYSFTGNASDLSTFANNAVVNGATATQDRFGWANSAFAFDGVQGSIQANNAAQLNSGNVSISFWVKVNALPATGEVFLLSHGGWQERWKISLPSHGKPVFTTNSTGGIKDMDTDSVALKVGAWTQVVMVHDSVTGMNKAYINGVLKKAIVATGNLNKTTKPLGMGFDPIDAVNYFKGSLDEVTLYNVALTDAQIATLYAAQNTAPVIANGRVASYSFNGSARDSSSFGNHGVLNNVKETTDRFGFGSKAYSFNGTSSGIKVSNAAQQNSALTTISFWVKVGALPAQGEVYLLSNGGWQERWKISLPAHGKPVFSTKNVGTGNSDMDAGDGNVLPVGVWKHVVMTHDGAKDKIFIDGVKKAEKAVVGNLLSTVNPLGIGYDPIDNGSFFNGSLDEVQIYNYAFAEADVTALYTVQSTSPAVVSDIVADYKLMGSGKDDSQYGNTATGKATPSVNRFNLGSNAMNFNGTDSLVAPNSIALQSNFTTVSFWVKVKELPAQGEVFLLSNGGWQERWKISLPSHGKPVFTTNAAGGIKDMDSDSVPLPVGQWRHVVAVHDGANDKLFINGLLKKSIVQTGALNKTGYPLGIGYNPVDGGGNFKGDLDDIRVYNRALTDAEVLILYGAQNVAPTITGTLVAHYPFNNDGSDITAYANNAVIRNAVPTKDRFNKSNKAISVKASTITAANSPQQNSANTTISFWIKATDLPANGEYYVLSNGGWQERWKISLPGHGKIVFSTKNVGTGNSDMDAGDGNALPLGVWKHVVMTHDGAKDKIFIDGVKKAEKVVVGALLTTTKPLGIGYDPIDSTNFFNGALDEVQIYNTALTEAEVAALYTAQNTAPIDTDITAPSAPLNLAAVVAFTNVTLSWLPANDNVGVVAYNVFKNNEPIGSVTNTLTLLTGLPATTKFTFGVTAVDAAGNESAMSTLQVTTGQEQARDTIAPTKPGALAAQIGSNSVQLTWTASTDNRAVTGYVTLKDGIILDTVPATTLSKFVGGLTALTAYTFNVYAIDAAGNKSAQAEITVTTKAELNTGEAGLIANYPFDDNANDATPYLNHGVIGGSPTFITHTGFTGKAIKFNGRDSVLVKNAVQLISDYTSVGFWIRVDSIRISDAEAYVIDFGHWDQRWKISLPQHLKIVWTTNSKNAQFANAISDMDSKDGNELVKGIWWHVIMVHDGVNDIIYVNGVETNRKPAAGKLNSTARALCFGSNPVDGGQYFPGALDNVKIYNKALTATEANKLFRTGATPTDDQASAELLNVVKNVSPNPAKDVLTIKHAFTGDEDVLVRVMDVAGRQVDAVHFGKNAVPTGQFSLNVSSYSEGVYFLNFVQGGKSLGAVKFVKQ